MTNKESEELGAQEAIQKMILGGQLASDSMMVGSTLAINCMIAGAKMVIESDDPIGTYKKLQQAHTESKRDLMEEVD